MNIKHVINDTQTLTILFYKIMTILKPYECNICNTILSQLSTLNKHSVVYSGEKAVCDPCTKTFYKTQP